MLADPFSFAESDCTIMIFLTGYFDESGKGTRFKATRHLRSGRLSHMQIAGEESYISNGKTFCFVRAYRNSNLVKRCVSEWTSVEKCRQKENAE